MAYRRCKAQNKTYCAKLRSSGVLENLMLIYIPVVVGADKCF